MYTANKEPSAKILVLLVNIGAPKECTFFSVKEYLFERFNAHISSSWWRKIFFFGYVIPKMASKLLLRYRRIWLPNGAPILVNAKKQAERLQLKFVELKLFEYDVSYVMCYGAKSIEVELDKIIKLNINYSQIVVVPLYPQASMSELQVVIDKIHSGVLGSIFSSNKICVIEPYYTHDLYIQALSANIKKYLDKNPIDHLVFYFYSRELQDIRQYDLYLAQCKKTVELVVIELGLHDAFYSVVFNPRSDIGSWVRPYTSDIWGKLLQLGVNNIAVICPGCSVDDLESLEEINIVNREYFYQAGGKKFYYIPALNDEPRHIELLKQLVLENSVIAESNND